MMDQQCINSIVKCIMQSDMSELNIRQVVTNPISVKRDGEEEYYESRIFVKDGFFGKSAMSDAWIAGNLLVFTAFNGYLENKYQLKEGASFRKHYDNLPENTDIEKIIKNCYRIMKIIRNAIQHNLSNVKYNSGNYDINYCHKNSTYKLNINKNAISCLYTIVVNIIREGIRGIPDEYMTDGHYEGIIYSLYSEMNKGIGILSDDIGTKLLSISGGLQIRMIVRYPIKNPCIIAEDEKTITFSHIENNGIADENDKDYCYSQDYIYKDYLLPQEIGTIVWGKGELFMERIKGATICFKKEDLIDKWKMHL